ncbi:NlpC/P60 family protein [Actinomadura sp. KC345]|uniref:C40 family peptidase n=1 Tax=Actinomadura sp. KC345 TaxID=2530371 RepID=UPI001FB82D4A|nr:NlpC/P60 family protein [Actinomadura sp. KC345]
MFFALTAITVAITLGSQCTSNGATGGTPAIFGEDKGKGSAASIPTNYLKYYVEIGDLRNIPANVLAGIGRIETDHGQSTLPGARDGVNYAGAGGPMQFLKSSWDIYGADENGDGEKDLYDPADAILGATNHLRGSIGKKKSSIPLSSSDIRRAVHLYNPGNYTPQSNPYARSVLAAANGYDDILEVYQKIYGDGSEVPEKGDACSASLNGSGSFGQRIAYAAAYFAKKEKGTPRPPEQKDTPTPYSWGGGTLEGVGLGIAHGSNTVGFDCSGLARHAVHKASKGKIVLARTTQQMWHGKIGTKILKSKRSELAPGDLVFFNSDISHMAIYYGEVDGVRWMVEAQRTGTPIKFSKFDERGQYMGALRIEPPPGMAGESPDTGRE